MAGGVESSNGERPLAPSQYFARLTQRLVAAVTAPTSEGVLYRPTCGCRPSGNAGPLATSLDGFPTISGDSAWTWEHLALTPRAGRRRETTASARWSTASIAAQMCGSRADVGKIVEDVTSMRALMAQANGRRGTPSI